MKLKNIVTGFSAIVLLTALLSACNDDFMDRVPSTAITGENFFSNVNDLKTYTDNFYSTLSAPILDGGSDNLSHHNSGSTIDNIMRGGVTPQNASAWSWTGLRNINFFLENYGKVQGANAADVNHYVGIARFFRARFYIDMVKRYGDVPWYGKTLGTNDEELLYKAQDPRALVVDSVMADLEFAVANIKPDGHKSTVTRWAALAQLAQFALYEGTYRKYHDYLGLASSHTAFLERAAAAAKTIMTEGGFALQTGNPERVYRELFISENLGGNRETILFIDYDKDLGRRRNAHTVLDYEWALSQSLMESYLMKDGSRYTAVAGYATHELDEVFVGRDPRLAQTFMKPGFQPVNATQPYRTKPSLGGYNQIKFYPEVTDMISWEAAYTDAFVFRFAEVLLTYAEAKAELGSITQGDLDETVNLIRARVDMPALTLAYANGNIDPELAAYYPNVTGANTGVILEIRRERRVELACEGFRQGDLFRWEAGERLADQQQGMFVAGLGALDVTGDGVVDIAILEAPGATGPIDNLPAAIKDNLSLYYLKDANGNQNSFYLEHGDYGHIMFSIARDQPKTFVKPRHYYFPIAHAQVVLNPNLNQPIGWE
ncbi:RagB/SusD family nutrient uptake outer membrane protein [Parapedobacter deserti]|uniref:RagB/SusD family nutrient uptake outer membrane protein n=1 Tax=Parapedobacter deserti TaxID=1912957 RepID=A0ABV7JJK4_9SPHI